MKWFDEEVCWWLDVLHAHLFGVWLSGNHLAPERKQRDLKSFFLSWINSFGNNKYWHVSQSYFNHVKIIFHEVGFSFFVVVHWCPKLFGGIWKKIQSKRRIPSTWQIHFILFVLFDLRNSAVKASNGIGDNVTMWRSAFQTHGIVTHCNVVYGSLFVI